MAPTINEWKPVGIDNIPINSLEGLIGIEECTNYDVKMLNNKSSTTKVLHNSQKKRKKKSATAGAKQSKLDTLDLTPSKQGCTEDRNNENVYLQTDKNLKDELNLESVKSWENLPIHEYLLKALASLKFTEPTNIQLLTLPAAILGKRDILGAAETGSGKTLAFGLPILQGIIKLKEESKLNFSKDNKYKKSIDFDESDVNDEFNEQGINLVKAVDDIELPQDVFRKPLYALILTPTRELAIQVKQHLSSLAKFTDITVAVVIGGMAVEKQLRILNKGPEIVVATPGRLWELIEEGNQHLSQINNIKFLAIDETDRMLEKGHFRELEKILERINADDFQKEQRQNFVFSATLTLIHELPKYLLTKKRIKSHSKIADLTPAQKLRKIVDTLNITNPKVVDITQGKGTPESLTECKITCSAEEKDYYLYYFLVKHPGRTLIFCNSIGCVRRLVTILSLLNCNPVALHSSLHQRQRLKNLDKFKDNDKCVLIATDVAARGLDISCIQHVIHYQTPRTSESYVHRSGRTARGSNEGITILLVEPGELQQYLRLCRTLEKTEDLPLFPVEESFLAATKERVNLARELDKLELKVRKSNSEFGWIEKAAEEMDIILDDDICKHDKSETHTYKKVADIKRKQLSSLLQTSICPKNFNSKHPLSSGPLSAQLGQGKQEPKDALQIMKNAIKTNTIKQSLKTKHLFKPKIRREPNVLNLNSFLKKKDDKSMRKFKGKKMKKNRKR